MKKNHLEGEKERRKTLKVQGNWKEIEMGSRIRTTKSLT